MRSVDLDEVRIEPAQADREIDWPVAPPSETDLPAGEYVASYRGAKRGQWFGQQKVQLLFEIVTPAHSAGIKIPLFATLPTGRRLSQRSKYFGLWVKANGALPLGGDRMSPRVFRGYWDIRIGWSKPKDGGAGMPQIIELIERVAEGSKPCR